jgi:hypothetical protein
MLGMGQIMVEMLIKFLEMDKVLVDLEMEMVPVMVLDKV